VLEAIRQIPQPDILGSLGSLRLDVDHTEVLKAIRQIENPKPNAIDSIKKHDEIVAAVHQELSESRKSARADAEALRAEMREIRKLSLGSRDIVAAVKSVKLDVDQTTVLEAIRQIPQPDILGSLGSLRLDVDHTEVLKAIRQIENPKPNAIISPILNAIDSIKMHDKIVAAVHQELSESRKLARADAEALRAEMRGVRMQSLGTHDIVAAVKSLKLEVDQTKILEAIRQIPQPDILGTLGSLQIDVDHTEVLKAIRQIENPNPNAIITPILEAIDSIKMQDGSQRTSDGLRIEIEENNTRTRILEERLRDAENLLCFSRLEGKSIVDRADLYERRCAEGLHQGNVATSFTIESSSSTRISSSPERCNRADTNSRFDFGLGATPRERFALRTEQERPRELPACPASTEFDCPPQQQSGRLLQQPRHEQEQKHRGLWARANAKRPEKARAGGGDDDEVAASGPTTPEPCCRRAASTPAKQQVGCVVQQLAQEPEPQHRTSWTRVNTKPLAEAFAECGDEDDVAASGPTKQEPRFPRPASTPAKRIQFSGDKCARPCPKHSPRVGRGTSRQGRYDDS